jgi:Zn-finger in ubiquitin-hydrolases and other protein
MVSCTHLDQILVDRPDQTEGCEECLKIGGTWMHLRVCRTCGKVGCCDSSPNQHASRHARESEHPIMTSVERGEDWSWCFVDEVAFIVSDKV